MMEIAVAIVMLAGISGFLIGFGQMVGSMGEEYMIAVVSAAVVVACTLWAWGYSCGVSVEDEESE